ncbi:hypothetical protein GGQ92_002893 [Gracilibacillus halotolerans]|uniref:YesK-like protein n=1 Tax=Gracilibacillus halotolerans TaxID=74386 RepID=A0A841RQE6_9BACI|nr:YesK family protein [Gracilibacillus halotolerans]MBB6514072.1 hypothetical protein [Gracilibacillus halotolerans]
MMVYVPFGLGIVIGLIMVLATKLLEKFNYTLSILPSIIGFVAVAVLIFVSFEVRGFEGAGYALLGIPIFLFSLYTLIMALNDKNKAKE